MKNEHCQFRWTAQVLVSFFGESSMGDTVDSKANLNKFKRITFYENHLRNASDGYKLAYVRSSMSVE